MAIGFSVSSLKSQQTHLVIYIYIVINIFIKTCDLKCFSVKSWIISE